MTDYWLDSVFFVERDWFGSRVQSAVFLTGWVREGLVELRWY